MDEETHKNKTHGVLQIIMLDEATKSAQEAYDRENTQEGIKKEPWAVDKQSRRLNNNQESSQSQS